MILGEGHTFVGVSLSSTRVGKYEVPIRGSVVENCDNRRVCPTEFYLRPKVLDWRTIIASSDTTVHVGLENKQTNES